MKSLITKLLSSFLLALLFGGSSLAADTTAKVKVTGMYCDVCQTKIHQPLSETDGIKTAQVDLQSGSATVTFETLAPLMRRAGFRYVFLGIENILERDLQFLRASAKNTTRENRRNAGNATPSTGCTGIRCTSSEDLLSATPRTRSNRLRPILHLPAATLTGPIFSTPRLIPVHP